MASNTIRAASQMTKPPPGVAVLLLMVEEKAFDEVDLSFLPATLQHIGSRHVQTDLRSLILAVLCVKVKSF